MPKKPSHEEVEAELIQDPDTHTQSDSHDLVLSREMYPGRLPIAPVQVRPFFPHLTLPMMVDQPSLMKMLIDASQSDKKFVGLVLRREAQDANSNDQPVTIHDLYEIGVVARVHQINRQSPQGPVQALLETLDRFRIVREVRTDPYLLAEVDYLLETDTSTNQELKAYSVSVIKSIKELVQLNPLHKEELNHLIANNNPNDPGRLADIAAVLTTADASELQDILETLSVRHRLQKVAVLLKKEIEISQLQAKIGKQIEERISKQQREFFLREQLKEIKKELGLSKDDKQTEIDEFEKRLQQRDLPDETRKTVDAELSKLKLLEPASPEFTVTRNYLDWLTILPWGLYSEDNTDIDRAAGILDEDHYGLDDVKERILEFLSVGVLKGDIAGSILCFVGPPGVGKTSIGQSIARSMGREFYRFSIGGMRDEAEIKGHRRTYIGAMPGKFIQSLKVAGKANPVIMLDEIDKIGASYHGDPASALLEVLDPEQNRDFLDHYLDVRFDLSNVFFICTANQLDTIPRALLDRMEVIKLAGYIMEEKLEIARRYLVPKQLRMNGVRKNQLTITKRALREIVEGYAREPGVRSLEKYIGKIIRKSVRPLLQKPDQRIRIDPGDVAGLLGKRTYSDEDAHRTPTPGVVRGLAWTSLGGDTLFVEATHTRTGKAGFEQTGQLGNVMIESAKIAYTYTRHYLDNRPGEQEFFDTNHIHLHVPAGATPKDGPSAGITMAAALYSLAAGLPPRKGFAMTGELGLTGTVMPVGGIKEKLIAAKRNKIRNIILPGNNRPDVDELPDHVKKGLSITYVHQFSEVVDALFPKNRKPSAR